MGRFRPSYFACRAVPCELTRHTARGSNKTFNRFDLGTSLTKHVKTGYNAACQGRRTTMVVNGEKIFFSNTTLLRSGVG